MRVLTEYQFARVRRAIGVAHRNSRSYEEAEDILDLFRELDRIEVLNSVKIEPKVEKPKVTRRVKT